MLLTMLYIGKNFRHFVINLFTAYKYFRWVSSFNLSKITSLHIHFNEIHWQLRLKILNLPDLSFIPKIVTPIAIGHGRLPISKLEVFIMCFTYSSSLHKGVFSFINNHTLSVRVKKWLYVPSVLRISTHDHFTIWSVFVIITLCLQFLQVLIPFLQYHLTPAINIFTFLPDFPRLIFFLQLHSNALKLILFLLFSNLSSTFSHQDHPHSNPLSLSAF